MLSISSPPPQAVFLVALLTGILLDKQVSAQEAVRYDSRTLLVKSTEPRIIDFQKAHGARVIKTFKHIGNWAVIELPQGTGVLDARESYRSSGLVHHAELNYRGRAAACANTLRLTTNDPEAGNQWYLDHTGDVDIDGPEAWKLRTSTSVVVAILDTGINYNHPDLTANIWFNLGEDLNGNGQFDSGPPPAGDVDGIDTDGNGYADDFFGIDPYESDADPMDTWGHGTQVAGVIGAVGNNGIGITGTAWDVKLMAIRIALDDALGWQDDAILSGFDYAIENGAKIVNASFFTPYSQAVRDAIAAARNRGITVVAAAGNFDKDNDHSSTITKYPASYDLDNIVSVGATTSSDTKWSGSHWGRVTVDLFAPGTNIETTDFVASNYFYGPYTGTSYAAPQVAGAVALMEDHFFSESYIQLINRLFSATDILPGFDELCQTGARLNLNCSLDSPALFPPPMNDDLAAAFDIALPDGVTTITATGNNVHASKEPGENPHAGNLGGKSVWWRWTSPPTNPLLRRPT